MEVNIQDDEGGKGQHHLQAMREHGGMGVQGERDQGSFHMMGFNQAGEEMAEGARFALVHEQSQLGHDGGQQAARSGVKRRPSDDSAAEEAAGILAGLGTMASRRGRPPPARRNSSSPQVPPPFPMMPMEMGPPSVAQWAPHAQTPLQSYRPPDTESTSPLSSPALQQPSGPSMAHTPPPTTQGAGLSPLGAQSAAGDQGGQPSPRGNPATPATEGGTPSGTPADDKPMDPAAKLPRPLPEPVTANDIPVYCGPRTKPEEGVRGWFNLVTWKIRWYSPQGSWLYITPTRFERLGGRGHWKKWRDSIVALTSDGCERCSIGELLPTSRTEMLQEVTEPPAGGRRSRGVESPRSMEDMAGASAAKLEREASESGGGGMLAPRQVSRRTTVFHPSMSLSHGPSALHLNPDMSLTHLLATSSGHPPPVLAVPLPSLGLHVHSMSQGAATTSSPGMAGSLMYSTLLPLQYRPDASHPYHTQPDPSSAPTPQTPLHHQHSGEGPFGGHPSNLSMGNPSPHNAPSPTHGPSHMRSGGGAGPSNLGPAGGQPSSHGAQAVSMPSPQAVQELRLEQYAAFLGQLSMTYRRCRLLEGEVEQEKQRRLQAERKHSYEVSLRRQDQEAVRQASMSLEQQTQRAELLRAQLSSETTRRQEEHANFQELQSRYNRLAGDANMGERQRQALEQELSAVRGHISSLERQITATQSRMGYMERQLESARAMGSARGELRAGSAADLALMERDEVRRMRASEGAPMGMLTLGRGREAGLSGGSAAADVLEARIRELEQENTALQEELFRFKLEAMKYMNQMQ